MFCPQCGLQNVNGARFCQNCGTDLNQEVHDHQGSAQQVQILTVSPSPSPPPVMNQSGLMTNPNDGQVNLDQEQVEYAHIGRRFVASLVDGIMLSAMISGISAVIGFIAMPKTKAMMEVMIIFLNVLQFALGLFYFSYMESSKNSATFGKMLLGIKVTDLDGNRISFGRGAMRYLAKIPSSMILLIGFIMAAFTDKRQALHDKLAGCLVVRKR